MGLVPLGAVTSRNSLARRSAGSGLSGAVVASLGTARPGGSGGLEGNKRPEASVGGRRHGAGSELAGAGEGTWDGVSTAGGCSAAGRRRMRGASAGAGTADDDGRGSAHSLQVTTPEKFFAPQLGQNIDLVDSRLWIGPQVRLRHLAEMARSISSPGSTAPAEWAPFAGAQGASAEGRPEMVNSPVSVFTRW